MICLVLYLKREVVVYTMLRHRYQLLSVLLLICLSAASRAQTITVCSPYHSAPFVIDHAKKQGIIYDFVDYLNQNAPTDWRFKLAFMPRARLFKQLSQDEVCIVPFVSPLWFDPDKSQYHWSKAIFADGNVILSDRTRKLESLSADIIAGLSTSRVIGQKNDILDALIKQKVITAFNSNSLESSVEMLALGRVDFVVSGKLLLGYIVAQRSDSERFYFSHDYVQTFDRAVLFPKSMSPQVIEFVENKLTELHLSADGQLLSK